MRFRLIAGADELRFREIDKEVQTEVAYRESGLARRTTARSAEGEWVVLETWHSEADADAAASHRRDQPIYARFQAMVDQASVGTDRYMTFD